MTERPPSSDADGSWEAWTDLRPNTPEEQARIDRAAAIKSWFQPSPDQHPAPAAVPPSSDAAGWKSAIGSGNSRTVFDFPDGTTGPGTWDPKTQTIVKAYSTDTIEGPSSDAGSPIDVERDRGLLNKVRAAMQRAAERNTRGRVYVTDDDLHALPYPYDGGHDADTSRDGAPDQGGGSLRSPVQRLGSDGASDGPVRGGAQGSGRGGRGVDRPADPPYQTPLTPTPSRSFRDGG